MPYFEFIWTGYAKRKIADRYLSEEDVEEVIQHGPVRDTSRSTGLPIAMGYTSDGRWIVCVYRQIDEILVQPVTAYEPREE